MMLMNAGEGRLVAPVVSRLRGFKRTMSECRAERKAAGSNVRATI